MISPETCTVPPSEALPLIPYSPHLCTPLFCEREVCGRYGAKPYFVSYARRISPLMPRHGVHPPLGPVSDGMSHVPLKLGLHHLITLPLHDLLRLDGKGLGPIRYRHREGIEAVVSSTAPA